MNSSYIEMKHAVLSSVNLTEDSVFELQRNFVKSNSLNTFEKFQIFCALLSSKEKNELARKFYPLALGMAKKMAVSQRRQHEMDDLIGVAQLALAEVLNRFDPTKVHGYKEGEPPDKFFGPLAKKAIHDRLINYLRRSGNVPHVSLDLPAGREMDRTIVDSLKSKVDEAKSGVRESEVRSLVDQMLKQLSEQEKYILIKRYGLDRKGEKPIANIAKEMGYTRATITNWHNNAIKKLQAFFRKIGLTPRDVLANVSIELEVTAGNFKSLKDVKVFKISSQELVKLFK